MSKQSIPIILDTKTLKLMADRIIAETGPSGPGKHAMLNIMAAAIAGPKHNWGYLTSATTPIIAQGVPLTPAELEAEALIDPVPLVDDLPHLQQVRDAFYLLAEGDGDIIQAIDDSDLSDDQMARAVERASREWMPKPENMESFCSDVRARGELQMITDPIVDYGVSLLLAAIETESELT